MNLQTSSSPQKAQKAQKGSRIPVRTMHICTIRRSLKLLVSVLSAATELPAHRCAGSADER